MKRMRKKNSVKIPIPKEKKDLDQDIRKSLSGNFVKLENGVVHYQIGGPNEGELIILIHGFSSPMFIWDPTYFFLIEQGFRVLRYDLFGRGLSDRPKVKYTEILFDQQLLHLIQTLKITEHGKKITLFGLSMGGIIAVNFIDNHPDLVDRLVLIDPAGIPTGKRLIPRLLKIPFLNKLIFNRFGPKLLVSKIADDFLHLENYPKFQISYTEQMEYKGFLRAILSTILNLDLESYQKAYAQIGKKNDFPVLLIWGELDKTIPYESHSKICNVISQIEFHSIPNARHLPHYEQSEQVNNIIQKFLRKNSILNI